ncbi:glutamate--cysteine ligase [Nocardia sp. NPDC058519]|uniref:carboxylate-amine ligase n=1 Tax=Nocardia sp. NPDC058519 TaxID=3346535 RepID=UPI00364CAE4F
MDHARPAVPERLTRPIAAIPSMGVEEEFLLIDPATGQPLMRNSQVVTTAEELGLPLQLELSQCQIETNSAVCSDSRRLRAHLLEMRSIVAAAALDNGSEVLATGTSPIGPAPMPISDTPRYRRMAERFGALVHEQAICGCHVHVDAPDRETAVQVCNHVRPWLPTLLALGANSPLYNGTDTGYASWRTILWSRWPVSGPPPYFDSALEYDTTVATMIDSGCLLDEKMVYWDIRPSSHLPTVEIRVSDVQQTVDETTLIAILARALVMTAQWSIDRDDPAPKIAVETLRVANWMSARNGLIGDGLDPHTARAVPISLQIELLLDHIRDALDELGEAHRVKAALERSLVNGNGAIWQRSALLRNQCVADMVKTAARRTLRDSEPE